MLRVIDGLIDSSHVNKIDDILNVLPYRRQYKDRFARTWSSQQNPDVASKILEIIGKDKFVQIRKIIHNMGLPEDGENLLSIKNFTVIKLSGIDLPLAWHRDSYVDESGKFVGIEPFTFKMALSIKDSGGMSTVFAPFYDSKRIVNSEWKAFFVSLNPKVVRIQSRLSPGDAQIFRTDVMHKRPVCFWGNRENIIFTFLFSDCHKRHSIDNHLSAYSSI